jgi:hypothetical protein
MGKRELKQIIEQLDRIRVLLEIAARPQSLAMRIINGIATGVGILGVLSSVEVVRLWIGG